MTGQMVAPHQVRELVEVEPVVRGICRRRLGREDGDDKAQLVLLRIWQRLVDGREIHNLRSYAVSSAYFELIPHRQDRVPDLSTDPDVAAACWADTTPGPGVAFDEDDVIRAAELAAADARLDDLLTHVTRRQADVLRATVCDGRSPLDAAEELGISRSMAYADRSQGLARLRKVAA